MRRLCLIVLLLAGCAAGTARTVSGVVVLSDTGVRFDGAGRCRGTGDYSDLVAGAPLVVSDEAGTVIGTGSLTAESGVVSQYCRFAFQVDVPDVGFYTLSVNLRQVGTFSRQDLDGLGWQVYVEVG